MREGMAEGGLFRAGAEAAIGLLVRPAFLVDGVKVVLANEPGVQLLHWRPRLTAECIHAAVAGLENPLLLAARGPLLYTRRPVAWLESFAKLFALSPREAQVLDLLSRGLRNRAIAYELHIAEVTVENHVTSLLRKARARGRTALVAKLLVHAAGEAFP